MNIIIQGRQGSGKTLKAYLIEASYPASAIFRNVPFRGMPSLAEVSAHAERCHAFGDTPLFVFDDLSREDLVYALSLKNALKQGKPEDYQIDAIFITNDHMKIE